MVIASIDLMNGRAVQLREGRDKVLERDNPLELARQFDRLGEIAVIDLDAALNRGENRQLIRQLCAVGDFRVGGGIRTAKEARELVSYGAVKIIIGSRAFGANGPDMPFLNELAQQIGRERIIVAVDARNGEIVTNGWRTKTGLDLIDTAKQLEPAVSELLFTCVEKEGHMQGTDLELAGRLRSVFKKPLTVAGGVHTLEEIASLARLGIDAQLGMALYTGAISLDEAFSRSLDWSKTPLLPIIAADGSGQPLMLAWTNPEALQLTLKSGEMHYFSRSRQCIWKKGETSGHGQKLIRLRPDCDRDTLLATVEQTGPACHTDRYSCFSDRKFSMQELYDIIAQRFAHPVPGSYTASLTAETVREKLMEEAAEVVEAKGRENVIWEAADVLYFLSVLMQKEGVTPQEVFQELRRRKFK